MVKYIKKIKDFSGGLYEAANDNIPENGLITAKNVTPGDGYGISKATGTNDGGFPQITETVNGETKAYPVVLIVEFKKSDGETQIVAFTEIGANAWHMFWLDGSLWTQVTNTNPDADPAGAFPPVKDWFVYGNKLYWVDGTKYNRWDGEAHHYFGDTAWKGTVYASTSASSPLSEDSQDAATVRERINASESAVLCRYQFFFGHAAEVSFSMVGSADTFYGTGIVNFNSGVEDEITKLHEFGDGILVFQKRSIYYFQWTDLTALTGVGRSKLNAYCGTKYPKTVKTVENAVLYMGDDGLYKLRVSNNDETIAINNISDKKISKTLVNVAENERVISYYAEVHDGVYYLCKRTSLIAGRTETETIKEYRYYTADASFWGEYTQSPYCYASRLKGTDRLYIGCANGRILYYDSGSYHYVDTETMSNLPIPIMVVTKGYDVIGNMVQDAKIKKAFVVLKQYTKEKSSFTIQIKLDYKDYAYDGDISSVKDIFEAKYQKIQGDDSLVWDEGKWSQAYWGWLETVTKSVSVNSKCLRAQFIFREDGEDETPDKPLLIYGVALLYKRKKVKGSKLGTTAGTALYLE